MFDLLQKQNVKSQTKQNVQNMYITVKLHFLAEGLIFDKDGLSIIIFNMPFVMVF